MSWRDRLQKASFRGVEFQTRAQSTEIGRRTVLHEYPGRDDAFGEDMGRRARRFSVEALVIGPDYDRARDALITALETYGAGELVHPRYGRRQVILVGPVRISESSDEGGLARFTLDFAEAGASKEPASRADTPSLVEAAADNAIAAAATDFADRFSIDNQPGWLTEAAEAIGGGVMDALDGVRLSLAGLPNIGGVTGLSDVVRSANGIRGSLSKLLRTPGDFASGIFGLIGDLAGLAPTTSELLGYLGPTLGGGRSLPTYSPTAVMKPLTSFGAGYNTVPTTTPARRQQADNQQAMIDLVRRGAVIESARSLSTIEFDNSTQAIALRGEIADQIDVLAEGASGPRADDVFNALMNLRAAVVKDVNARGAALPALAAYRLPATLPALVVAHRRYGDATRADEIVGRNAVRHPGFVPGGVDLEVLADA